MMQKSKKVLALIMVIYFLVQPLFTIITNSGNVQARTVSARPGENVNSKIAPNEQATFNHTEYMVAADYSATYTTDWVSRQTKDALLSSPTIYCTNSQKGNRANLSAKVTDEKTNGFFEKKYIVKLTITTSYNLQYWVTDPSLSLFSNFTARWNGSGCTFSVLLRPNSYRITDTRMVYNVTYKNTQPQKQDNTPQYIEVVDKVVDKQTPSTGGSSGESTGGSTGESSGQSTGGSSSGGTYTPVTPVIQKYYKEISLNKELRDACYTSLKKDGYDVSKSSDTVLKIEQNDFNRIYKLDLGGKGLKDLSGLNNFSNLKELYAGENDIENLDEIVKLKNLEILWVNRCKLSDIRNIENLTNLKSLGISNNKENGEKTLSVEGIEKLSKLEYLNVEGCNLGNNSAILFSETSQLGNLKELVIGLNNITSSTVKQIGKCSKLESLWINNNNITNIDFLDQLPNLKRLYIHNNSIMDLIKLSEYNLERLQVNGNRVIISTQLLSFDLLDDIKAINDSNSKLYSKDDFECTDCEYKDGKVFITGSNPIIKVKNGLLENSEFVFKISDRSVTFNDAELIKRIEPQITYKNKTEENGKVTYTMGVEDLLKVENLDLSTPANGTKITDLTGIENFENLKVLYLRNNNISNLEKLSELRNLQSLDIRYNGLTTLNSLENVTSLRQLDASNNNLTGISGISKMENLEDLLLSNNNIGINFKTFPKLNNLSTLALSNNNISSVSALSELKLTNLFIDNNKISDVSSIDKEYLEYMNLENNTVTLSSEGTTVDVPEILKYAIEQNGEDCYEVLNCKIENDKIILAEEQKVGTIKIKDGIAKDTIIIFNGNFDLDPPELKVEYNKINDYKMSVTIKSNEKIKLVSSYGWRLSENEKEATKEYVYSTLENVIVEDLSGNQTKQRIYVKDINNSRIPGLRVEYSDYNYTNGTVTISIHADVDLKDMYESWTLSEDKRTMTYVTDTNLSAQQVTVWTTNGVSEFVGLDVQNIDKLAPKTYVEYSTTDSTKGSVTATIWSNEEIKIKGSLANKYNPIVRPLENGEAKYGPKYLGNSFRYPIYGDVEYGIQLQFSDNTSTDVEVSDYTGNKTTVHIDINNIDKQLDGLYSKIDANNKTTNSVNLIVGANEKIKLLSNLNKNTEEEVVEANKPVFTIAGSLNAIPVMQGYTEFVKANPIMFVSSLNSNFVTRIAENEATQTVSGDDNTIRVEISDDISGVVQAEDEKGNKDAVLVNTSMVDKYGPVLVDRKDTKNDDGSVTVTLTFDEAIKQNDDIAGWSLSDNLCTLTKTYTTKANGKLIVTDLVGNASEYSVEFDNDEIPYSIFYEEIEGKDYIVAVISAENELNEVEGWTLSEDKKMLAKAILPEEKLSVTITDTNGNSNLVNIEYYGGKSENEDENGNKTTDETDIKGGKKTDDTLSDGELPNGGAFIAFGISSCIIVTLITLTVLVIQNEKEKYSK